MKFNKSVVAIIILLIVAGSLFRILNFAPQIAMGVFGGAVIKDKRLAFVLPLLSMFISDILFEVLYNYGLSSYGGFYVGQITNYILMAGVVLIGFTARNLKLNRIIIATLAAPSVYFLVSNFLVWLNMAGFSEAGFNRPKTFGGLMLCYNDAIPFFRSGLINTIVFSAILFGGYFLAQRYLLGRKQLSS
jgi:hypothetical protein